MSFILDALKKLEKKRQQAVVPDLTTIHASQPHKPVKKSIWAYLIIVALLLNAGILGMWLGSQDSKKQVISEQPTSLQQELASIDKVLEDPDAVKTDTHSSSEDKKNNLQGPNAEEEKTSPAAETAKDESHSGQSDVSAKSSSDTTAAVREEQVTNKQMEDVESSSDATAAVREEQVTNKQVEDVESSSETVTSRSFLLDEEELDDLRKKIKKEQFFKVDNPAPETLEPEEPDNALRKDIIDMSQLPSDIKKELPDLSIKTHIYSNSPSTRIVNINGNMYREGEIISKGLTLEEITTTGVIFKYKDHFFRVRSF